MVKSTLSLLLIVTSTIVHATPIITRASDKRGVAFENGAVTRLFSKLHWGYNWHSNGFDTSVPGKFEYVPMLKSDHPEHVNSWKAHVDAAVKVGSKHILGFNEPDQCGHGGVCMQDISRTVAAHKNFIQPILQKYPGLRIGAPAVTNGVRSTNNTVMGTEFLRPFIKSCDSQGIKIDFVVAHWYDVWPVDQAAKQVKKDYFKKHMQNIYEAGGRRKVWITEFGIWEGDQVAFLKEVMPWLDETSWIERYAFHFATPGVLVKHTLDGLTALGETYQSY